MNHCLLVGMKQKNGNKLIIFYIYFGTLPFLWCWQTIIEQVKNVHVILCLLLHSSLVFAPNNKKEILKAEVLVDDKASNKSADRTVRRSTILKMWIDMKVWKNIGIICARTQFTCCFSFPAIFYLDRCDQWLTNNHIQGGHTRQHNANLDPKLWLWHLESSQKLDLISTWHPAQTSGGKHITFSQVSNADWSIELITQE